jgi:hypothetical protein
MRGSRQARRCRRRAPRHRRRSRSTRTSARPTPLSASCCGSSSTTAARRRASSGAPSSSTRGTRARTSGPPRCSPSRGGCPLRARRWPAPRGWTRSPWRSRPISAWWGTTTATSSRRSASTEPRSRWTPISARPHWGSAWRTSAQDGPTRRSRSSRGSIVSPRATLRPSPPSGTRTRRPAGGTTRALLERLKVIAGKRFVPSYYIAGIYLGLDDRDHAFEWFERACAERCSMLGTLKVDPVFDVLRSDPRFAALLRCVRLAD